MEERISKIDEIDDLIPIRNVMISVYDTAGLEMLISGLLELCPSAVIYAAPHNYAYVKALIFLKKKKVPSITIGRLSAGGRAYKAKHSDVFFSLVGGGYQTEGEKGGATKIVPIDLAVINLRPITALGSPDDYKSVIQRIDVYGHAALSVAIANSFQVMSLSRPDDYQPFLKEIEELEGQNCFATRLKMAKLSAMTLQSYSEAYTRALGAVSIDEAKACFREVNCLAPTKIKKKSES